MATPLAPMLYAPATFTVDKLRRLADGTATFKGASHRVRRLAIDTEDAVGKKDLQMALGRIAELLNGEGPDKFAADVFIRVRNQSVLNWLLRQDVRRIRGIIVPKVEPCTFDNFAAPAVDAGLKVLPILESVGMSRASFRGALLNVFEPYRDAIDCIRLGGNDLMGCMSVRRDLAHGFTIHDQLPIVGTILTEFSFEGYNVTACVFEGIDPVHDGLFEQEVRLDVARGMFGKTVICPRQLSLLEQLYQVTPDELESATRILDKDAPAVANLHGRMDEPTTHWRWAKRIVERAKEFGVTTQSTVVANR